MSAVSLIAKSQEEAAETLGVNARTFARWLRRGCPGSPGSYVVSEAIKWARANIWSSKPDSSFRDATERERLRQLEMENERRAIHLGHERGEYLKRELVEAYLRHFVGALRESFEKLEREFGAEALDIVDEALQDLATADFSDLEGRS